MDHAVSSLARRYGKTLLLVSVYSLLVFIVASVLFFSNALHRQSALILADAPDLIVQRLVAGRHDTIPLEYAEGIGGITGVSLVRPRLWGYYFDTSTGANYTVQVDESRGLAPGGIAVGAGVATGHKIGKGSAMPFRGADGVSRKMSVAEVFSSTSDLLTADLVLMPLRDFRELFRFPAARATDFAVTVSNPREVSTVASKIAARFPDTRSITR